MRSVGDFEPISRARSATVQVTPTDAGLPGSRDWPLLPWPRGPLSAAVIAALHGRPGTFNMPASVSGIDVLVDDDFELALYLCYEQHYRSAADPGWEWDPGLLAFRALLERALLDRLRDEVGYERDVNPHEVVSRLDELIKSSTGPSLSGYLAQSGTFEQLCEFCVHRSAYQLKEADPHTFVIPRIAREAKAALIEIQFDEYDENQGISPESIIEIPHPV
ncbi:MAG: iron-containing redox enzyme family protein, partial [Acidobacteria bacterium]|nr:iron-containing redox enzyme family protein [Acidobacteriota bacterium]